MMNFRIISANHTSYMLISRPLVTPKTFSHTANITVRKLLVVPIQNFEVRLRRRWQQNFQPDNQENHYNSLTRVVMGKNS